MHFAPAIRWASIAKPPKKVAVKPEKVKPVTPKKVNEAQVAKVTDQYIENEIEEHKLADGDSSRQIGEKI